MEIKTLRTFQMIVDYGSFNRAAEEMNYAQSTVTMQIKKLETDLGLRLIERGKKKIRLTEAGRLLYEKSLEIVRDMEQLQTDLSDLQLGEAGNVRLGVTEPTASYRLPAVVKGIQSDFPKIKISLTIANTPALIDQLLNDEIDLAICSVPNPGTDLYFDPLLREEFVMLLPENHPLAEKTMIAPGDLMEHRLLVTSATCPYRKKLEAVLQESGALPLETMEIGSVTALKYYVKSGLGIALVPKVVLTADPSLRGTTTREFSNPITMTSGIVCKTTEYPLKFANLKVYQYLKQRFGAK